MIKDFLRSLKSIFSVSLFFLKQNTKRLNLGTFRVAGLQYGEAEYIALLQGEPAALKREAKNPHDPKAIAVYIRGIKAGYLPQHENKTLSLLMDQGVILEAIVYAYDYEKPPWERVVVKVWKKR
ncbi:MAG TPA: hypothetical protein CFH81_08220 [Sulfurovum sp. UBA12169]|jgi:HIRAN domain.|nr:MAG TPA: hypothetical protein CFH81_08220 [Sulfurovum sp. UBA12169]